RDARRREGPGPADAAAPRPAPSRGGAGGRDGRRRAGGHPRPRPRSALMALTGRLGLLALLGAIVPLFVPSWWSLFAVWGALLMGVVIDFALAGNVRALRFHRSGDTSVRLGGTAKVDLIVENLGRRRLKARIR